MRHERPEDQEAVRDVVTRAFGGRTVTDLADALRQRLHDAWGCSLVAELDGRVVGHVMLTGARVDAPARLVDVLVLSPLSVDPEHQGQGIGTALVRAALELADAQRAPVVLLEGDPRYYSRLGFTPAGAHGIRRPSTRIPEAAFQVALLAAYDSEVRGTLVYPDVWWDHDAVGLR